MSNRTEGAEEQIIGPRCGFCGESVAGMMPVFGTVMKAEVGDCVSLLYPCPSCACVISTQILPMAWLTLELQAVIRERDAAVRKAIESADRTILTPDEAGAAPDLSRILSNLRKRGA